MIFYIGAGQKMKYNKNRVSVLKKIIKSNCMKEQYMKIILWGFIKIRITSTKC